MTDTMFSRRQLALSAVLILAGLSMLLIPGVPAQVASVPETAWNSITTAWTWLGQTSVAVISWLF